MADQINHSLVGKPVRSKAVGNVGEFYGTVESAWYDEFAGDHFHVRDEAGRLFHRSHSDLILIKTTEGVPA